MHTGLPELLGQLKALPVVVFIHGGGNSQGSPGIYDGERMAQIAHAVVVIPALPLGRFGIFWPFLGSRRAMQPCRIKSPHSNGSHANAGTLGGSRSKVTIVGESAGGTNVCNLLATPAARGLFSAAVVPEWFSCYGAQVLPPLRRSEKPSPTMRAAQIKPLNVCDHCL